MNQDLLAKLGKMQEQLQKAQEEIENRVATGTAGGGAVTVEITGAYKVQSIKIEPEVIDPDDAGMLEDLVTAAVNEALTEVQAFHSENLSGLTGGLNLPNLPGLGGLGIPGLGGGAAPGGDAPAPPMNRAARRANKR
jgi:DNA-binding YbaB/EbfC family protein